MNTIRVTLSLILISLSLQTICSQPLFTTEDFSDYGLSGKITEFNDHVTLGDFRYEFYPVNGDANLQMNKASASAWGDDGYLQVGSLYKGYQEIKEFRIKNALGYEFSFISLMASGVICKKSTTEIFVSGYRDNAQVTETYLLSIDALRPGKSYHFSEFDEFKNIDEIRFIGVWYNNLMFFIEQWTYQYTSNPYVSKIESKTSKLPKLLN